MFHMLVAITILYNEWIGGVHSLMQFHAACYAEMLISENQYPINCLKYFLNRMAYIESRIIRIRSRFKIDFLIYVFIKPFNSFFVLSLIFIYLYFPYFNKCI